MNYREGRFKYECAETFRDQNYSFSTFNETSYQSGQYSSYSTEQDNYGYDAEYDHFFDYEYDDEPGVDQVLNQNLGSDHFDVRAENPSYNGDDLYY
jgi:hypothetical protein